MVSFSVCFAAITFVIVLFIPENHGFSLPSHMTACYGLDTECLTNKGNEYLKEFADGIPELGILPMDPQPLEPLKLNLGGLDVNFGPGTITGLSKCHIDKLSIKLKSHKIHFQATCNVTITGKYKTKGQILALRLDGDGDAKIKIKKLVIKTVIGFKFDERDGEHYMNQNNYTHSSKVLGNVHFDLTNLFGGNQELGTPVLAFLNQNWEQLYNEFSGPIIDVAVGLVVRNTNELYQKVPRSILTPGFDKLYKDQQ